MRYFFGHKLNVLPATLTTSEEVLIKTSSDSANISVSNDASLIVNSVLTGKSATVVTGDKVRVQASSPSILEEAYFFEVRQDSDLVGIFTLSSAQEPSLVRDDRYLGIPLYDTLPESDWELNSNIKIGAYVAGEYSEIEILVTSISTIPNNRIHVVDYHRKLLHILDTEGNYCGSLTLTKNPLAEQTIYSSGIRVGTVILFSDNTVSFYNNFYTEIKTINIGSNGGELVPTPTGFLTYFNNIVSKFDYPNFGKTDLTVESDVSCATYSTEDDVLYVASGVNLYAYVDGDLEDTIECPYEPVHMDSSYSELFIVYGMEGTFSTLVPISQTFTTHTLGGNLTYCSKDINSGVLWLSDFDNHLMYKYVSRTDIVHYQMSASPIGIVTALGNAFSPILYDNLPARFTINDKIPDVITLDAVESKLDEDVEFKVTLTGIGEPVELTAPSGTHIITPNRVTVADSQELTLKIRVEEMFYTALELPIVYGDKVAYFTLIPPAIEPLPDHFYFIPKAGQDLSASVTSDAVDILGLPVDAQVELTVEGGELILNGTLVESPQSVSNGDTVRLRGFSSDEYGSTTLVKASIKELDVYFAITTSFGVLHAGSDFSIPPNLYESVSTEISSAEVNVNLISTDEVITEVSIPDVYGARIWRDGVDEGRKVIFNNSDVTDLSFKSITGPYPGKYYPLPVIGIDHSALWLIRTEPVLKVHNFTFGEHDSDHMRNPVRSLDVVVSGIPEGEFLRMHLPAGLRAYINGSRVIHPLDYYGFSRTSSNFPVRLGDVIHLEAEPNSVYGEQMVYTISIGNVEGTFKINTPDAHTMIWDDDLTARLVRKSATTSDSHNSALASMDLPEVNSIQAPVMSMTRQLGQDIISIEKSMPMLEGFACNSTSILNSGTREVTEIFNEGIVLGWITSVQVSYSGIAVSETTELATYNVLDSVLAVDNEQVGFIVPTTYNSNETIYSTSVNYLAHTELSITEEVPFKEESGKPVTNFFEMLFKTDIPGEELNVISYGSAGALRSPLQVYDVEKATYILQSNFEVTYWGDYFKYLPSGDLIGKDLEPLVTFHLEDVPIDLYYTQGSSILNTYDVTLVPFFGVEIVKYDVTTFDMFGIEIISYDVQPNGNLTAELSTAKYNDYQPVVDTAIVFESYDTYGLVGDYIVDTTATVMSERPVPVASSDQRLIDVYANFNYDQTYAIDPESSYYVVFPNIVKPTTVISGYFATYAEAAAEAEDSGYEEGEYIVTEVTNKGFIWVIPMKCVNTCYGKCPPEGYIQGG